MARKIKKMLCPLLSLLLIVSFFVPVAASPSASVASSGTAFDFSESFDYKDVISQPRLVYDAASALSESQLRSLKLYPGGVPFGVKFMTDGVMVVGFCEIKSNPSLQSGLREGDRIISVNGKQLSSAEELTEVVENSGGSTLTLVYKRGEKSYTTSLTPIYSDSEKCYKTGLYVKDNGAGIGTVTYIVPDSLSFGGLGHGICDGESGKLLPISRGSVVGVTINGIVRGQSGIPGEVKGYFSSGKTGTLLQNTDCGVFGVFGSLPSSLPSEPLSLTLKNEICEGSAYIYCTLDGGAPQKYDIEICSIDRSATGGKCFTVKVTDPELLAKTGGIVQGMSGSPIIQNGKLAGAVTHVMINDPTTGYGIFIENMLANMQSQIMPKAA